MPDEKYQRTWEMLWRLMSVHTMVSLHALHTKIVNHKNKRRKRYMHIKYEIFEDRDEGDFCYIEKAQV